MVKQAFVITGSTRICVFVKQYIGWRRLHCFGCTHPPCIGDAEMEIWEFLEPCSKARAVVDNYKQSSSQKLRDSQKAIGAVPGLDLIQDAPTRWYIKFQALQRCVRLTVAMCTKLSVWQDLLPHVARMEVCCHRDMDFGSSHLFWLQPSPLGTLIDITTGDSACTMPENYAKSIYQHQRGVHSFWTPPAPKFRIDLET